MLFWLLLLCFYSTSTLITQEISWYSLQCYIIYFLHYVSLSSIPTSSDCCSVTMSILRLCHCKDSASTCIQPMPPHMPKTFYYLYPINNTSQQHTSLLYYGQSILVNCVTGISYLMTLSECASWVRKYVRRDVRRGTAGIAGMILSRERAGKLDAIRSASVTRS